jgi:fluoride ion exporter CrcB/FEX
VRQVLFGGAHGSAVRLLSAARLQVTAPPHAAGTVHVRVVTSSATSPVVTGDRFTFVAPPRVDGVSPAFGTAKGGTRVTLTGHNLVHVQSVHFGSVLGSSVRVLSSTKLAVTTPPHSVAGVNVRVTNS